MGTNHTFLADNDELTVLLLDGSGAVFAELLEQEGVQFKVDQFEFIARITYEPAVMMLSALSKHKTLDDLMNTQDKVLFSSSGAGTADHYSMKLIMDMIQSPYELITGYSGSNEQFLAAVRGEVI